MAKKIMIVGAVLLALVVGAGAVFAAGDAVSTAANCGIGVGRMLGGQNLMSEVEKATGLSWNDIRTARQGGKSLAQILTEKGKDIKAFVSSAVAARKQAVDGLVSSGKITKEQADLVMKNFQANIEQNLNNTQIGPNGNCGGALRGRGMMNVQGQAGQAAQGRGMGRGMGQGRGIVAPK